MNLTIAIKVSGKNEQGAKEKDWAVQDDLDFLKQVLKKNGITMYRREKIFGEDIYVLKGNNDKIRKKLSRGAGAKSRTANLKIQSILDIEKKYKGNSEGKEQALAEVGLKLRRYQQIKKSIKDVYGSLEYAIEFGHLYFVEPKNTKKLNTAQIEKKRIEDKKKNTFNNFKIL